MLATLVVSWWIPLFRVSTIQAVTMIFFVGLQWARASEAALNASVAYTQKNPL